MIALDDLHWADDATIELLAALLRRSPEAPVLLVLAFRPGSAPQELIAALAAPLAERIELGQLSEEESVALLGDVDEESRAAIYRHGGGNPFYLEQLARLDKPFQLEPGSPAPVPGRGPARRRRPRSPRSWRRSRPRPAPCSRRRRSPASPSIPASPARSPSSTTRPRSSALDELLGRELVRPTEVPRRFIFRHPLVRRSVYESIGGGSRLAAHARAAEVLAARGRGGDRARPPRRAGGGARGPGGGRGPARGRPPRHPAGRRRSRRAGSTAPCACCSTRIASARSRSGSRSPRRCAPAASSSAAARSCSRRSRWSATTTSRRRLQLIAWCAAVEHWLGRHEDAHLRLTRAWEELEDHGTAGGGGASGRALGRRHVHARLRADAGDGRGGAGPLRAARRSRA